MQPFTIIISAWGRREAGKQVVIVQCHNTQEAVLMYVATVSKMKGHFFHISSADNFCKHEYV